MKPTFLTTAILTILCIAVFAAGASFAADINATVNETFDITLPSNPSTGYSWTAEYDNTYLELVNQSYESSSTGFVVGSGGDEIFTFRAVEAGETNINFIYGGRGEIINTTSYSVEISNPIPANNTNVTPSNNTRTVPMQNTGIPILTLLVGGLAVFAGLVASQRK